MPLFRKVPASTFYGALANWQLTGSFAGVIDWLTWPTWRSPKTFFTPLFSVCQSLSLPFLFAMTPAILWQSPHLPDCSLAEERTGNELIKTESVDASSPEVVELASILRPSQILILVIWILLGFPLPKPNLLGFRSYPVGTPPLETLYIVFMWVPHSVCETERERERERERICTWKSVYIGLVAWLAGQMVSLFIALSTFVGYLMTKPFL